MKVLVVTNMWPSEINPKAGTFIERQVKGLRELGIDIEVLVVDRANLGKRQYARTRALVNKKIGEFSPQLVHVMYGGVMSAQVAYLSRRPPLVISFCGTDLLGEFSGSFLLTLRTRIGIWASSYAAKKAAAIIVKSRNLERSLHRSIDRSKVTIIPNGVDFDRFRPYDREECQSRLSWDRNRLHVLFSTNNRKDPNKRLDLAEAAVDILRRQGFNVELHGLPNVPHEEVPIWINASNLVLMTSIHEGSPNIVKEALACNCSVVSLDVGDVRERIGDIDGCFIALACPEDLADKMALVFQGNSPIQARNNLSDLSLENISARIEALYRRILVQMK